MNKTVLFISADEMDQIVIEDLDVLGYSLFAIIGEDPLGLQPRFKHSKLKEIMIDQVGAKKTGGGGGG